MKKKTQEAAQPTPAGRLQSLDVLRGFDMFFIMGGAGLIAALAQWFPCPFTEMLASQMDHVEWHGLAHHDTIFPLFLFIAGISFPFSLEKQRQQGKPEAAIYRKVIYRGLMLVFLGLIYNGLLNFNFENQRYASVLARIGLAWMFGALIFMNTRWKVRVWITSAILVGYWLAAAFVPAPDAGGADIFSAQGSIIGYVDRILLPGKVYYGNIDPEGILSTIPAIATALLGMFTGEWIKYQKEGLTANKKVWGMVAAGVAFLAVGLLWSLFFPINKKLWTSSFVLVVASYSILMFALFYYLIDVRNCRRGLLFFTVIGLNSITIYLGQSFINFSYTARKIFGGVIGWMPESAQPFFTQAAYIAVCWFFLYFLYKKKVFLKV